MSCKEKRLLWVGIIGLLYTPPITFYHIFHITHTFPILYWSNKQSKIDVCSYSIEYSQQWEWLGMLVASWLGIWWIIADSVGLNVDNNLVFTSKVVVW